MESKTRGTVQLYDSQRVTLAMPFSVASPQVHLSNVMSLCIKQIAVSSYFTSKGSACRSASAEEEP